ncbi:unnamed protein product, partial [Ectocarpus fasciculatus]
VRAGVGTGAHRQQHQVKAIWFRRPKVKAKTEMARLRLREKEQVAAAPGTGVTTRPLRQQHQEAKGPPRSPLRSPKTVAAAAATLPPPPEMLATPRMRAQAQSPSNKRRAVDKKEMRKNVGGAPAGNG